MKKTVLIAIAFTLYNYAPAQSTFADSIANYREKYLEEFQSAPNSPLKKSDLKHLQFFQADASFRVTASFQLTPEEKPFGIPTSSGAVKQYTKYGTATFVINERTFTLTIYQSEMLKNVPEYLDYLFLPFADLTNGEETYGGGRYIDLRLGDIKESRLVIDFNKAYNPYCAYSSGYSCPIPPEENHLELEVIAGEKNFRKKIH